MLDYQLPLKGVPLIRLIINGGWNCSLQLFLELPSLSSSTICSSIFNHRLKKRGVIILFSLNVCLSVAPQFPNGCTHFDEMFFSWKLVYSGWFLARFDDVTSASHMAPESHSLSRADLSRLSIMGRILVNDPLKITSSEPSQKIPTNRSIYFLCPISLYPVLSPCGTGPSG